MGAQRFLGIMVSITTFLFAFAATAAEPGKTTPAQVKMAAVQMLGYDKTDVPRPGFDPSEAVVRYVEKGAEILVWINGRRGTVEDFIVKSAMFQDEVAMVTTNQAYGAGTMIGQWPARIMASCPESKENDITATISLEPVRQARKNSRNLQQRRPELYGEIVKPNKK